MKNDPVIGAQPEIFRWARNSVGLTAADVATMLKRQPEEIEAWESGTAAPTYPQLEKLAYQIYKRPLAVFFLPFPPEETLPQDRFAREVISRHYQHQISLEQAADFLGIKPKSFSGFEQRLLEGDCAKQLPGVAANLFAQIAAKHAI